MSLSPNLRPGSWGKGLIVYQGCFNSTPIEFPKPRRQTLEVCFWFPGDAYHVRLERHVKLTPLDLQNYSHIQKNQTVFNSYLTL